MEEVTPSSPSPIRYINLLLHRMVKGHELSLTIRLSEPLPSVSPLNGNAPSANFTDTVNRLKVMSGLNPVRYPEPVDGAFQIFVRSVPYRVRTHFEDSNDDPYCRIDILMDDS